MKRMNKKASVVLYFVFMLTAIFVILIAAFFIPMAVRFNTEMYAAGEMIMLDSNQSISGIQNETVRNEIQGVIGTALSAGQNNIEVNSFLFQYSWVLVIGIVALVIFLYSRSMIELRSGGSGLA